jgi:hypothetical protein
MKDSAHEVSQLNAYRFFLVTLYNFSVCNAPCILVNTARN